jgi:hypothetical protein
MDESGVHCIIHQAIGLVVETGGRFREHRGKRNSEATRTAVPIRNFISPPGPVRKIYAQTERMPSQKALKKRAGDCRNFS